MATWDKTDRFLRDWERLTAEEQRDFMDAVRSFVEDLPSRQFRSSLRAKGVQGAPSIFEMSFGDGGRATFQYGEEVRPGEPHVIWRRIGGHEVFGNP